MDNKNIIEQLNKLPYEEQLEAYKLEHPEAYLVKKRIEEKKKQIRDNEYLQG